MDIKKFKDVTYDLSTTEDYLCHTITPITATTGETVSAIEVFNDIIVDQINPTRPLTATNMNATIDDISREINGKVPNERTVNSKALSSNILLTASDVGAEPAFTKNTAFNKNFGTTLGTVCQGSDARLVDSRRCNNTFDNIVTSKTNLGLHSVATSGNYNELTNKPYIPNEYDYFPGILMAAIAGFRGLNQLASNSSTLTKTLNIRKKYCFYGYGGYTSGYMYDISGGNWQSASLDFASDFVVIPEYTGTMGGSQKIFKFITNEGIFDYRATSDNIQITLNRPDCLAYGEVTLYNY